MHLGPVDAANLFEPEWQVVESMNVKKAERQRGKGTKLVGVEGFYWHSKCDSPTHA